MAGRSSLFDMLQVGGLQATCVLLNVEAQSFSFGDILETRLLDGRAVNENVLRAIIRRDEAEAFGRVEELDSPCGH